MVSAMTFEQLIETLARSKNRAQPDLNAAKETVLEFLGWDEVDEEQFGRETHVVLAAPDFSKELTTAVMWLIDQGINIRCVRMKPYRMQEGHVLVDVQQLIPLPEAADFQTQIGVKMRAKRESRSDRHDLRYRFWEALLVAAKARTDIHSNRSPTQDGWVSGPIGRSGFSLTYSSRMTDSQVELAIAMGTGLGARNKAAFHALEAQRPAIEADFGGALDWQELPGGDSCRIRYVVQGGYQSPQDQWPTIHAELIDAMIRLDKALHQRVAALTV
jgi:hypothetical protein